MHYYERVAAKYNIISGRIQRIAAALILCAVLLGAQISAAADSPEVIPNPDQKGSITITFTDPDTGEAAQYGNKVGLYKVADLVTDEQGFRFVYDELFASVGDAPSRDAQLNADLAQKLEETAEIKGISLDAASEEVDSEGTVCFKNQNAGIYLAVQTFRISDSDRFLIAPYLVAVPARRADGTLDYDVTAYPNNSGKVKKGSADQASLLADPPKSLPGVSKTAWPISLLAMSGALTLACGVWTRYRKE